jgi:hypothetical protein
VKGRAVFKWAIGVIAVVVLIGVGAVVSLFIVGFISLEKGERHRRQFQAELDSGRWDFGNQPALFAVAQGIVKNDPDESALRQRVFRICRRPEEMARRFSTSL